VDHIKNLYLAIKLLNVEHGDVVCRLFPYTFENKAYTWYFNFQVGSITNWGDFEKAFIAKFREAYTHFALLKELIAIKMDKKERVKDFN